MSAGAERVSRPRPTFAIVAHNDDWQMFMGRDLFEHIADPSERVVIVQVTAGDAGRSAWFWKARQQGAVASVIRATPGWSAVDLPTLTPQSADAVHDIEIADAAFFRATALPSGYRVRYDVAAVLHRSILRCVVEGTNASPTTIYFLHLPDGAVDGSGYAVNGYESLSRLAAGACAAGVRAKWSPPGSKPEVYAGWDALIEMLHEIVRVETESWHGDDDLWVHTMVEAPAAEDHADHALTSRAVSEVNRRFFDDRLHVARCYGYATQHWPTARNEAQRAVLAAYAAGFTAAAAGVHGWHAVWKKEFAWWGDREYWEHGPRHVMTSPCRNMAAPLR
ncbi:MAG: hypothetical protein NVS4B13_02610 [Candidatus Elarobacter sp.]